MSRIRSAGIIPTKYTEVLDLVYAKMASCGLPRSRTDILGEMVVKVLTGLEVGIPPMEALNGAIHSIWPQGAPRPKLSLDANAAKAVVEASGLCTEWVETVSDDKQVFIIRARRGDREDVTVSVHMRDYTHLHNKDNWRNHPVRMLRTKCIHRVVLDLFPDCLKGTFVPGGMDEVTDELMPGDLIDQDDHAPPQQQIEQQPAYEFDGSDHAALRSLAATEPVEEPVFEPEDVPTATPLPPEPAAVPQEPDDDMAAMQAQLDAVRGARAA